MSADVSRRTSGSVRDLPSNTVREIYLRFFKNPAAMVFLVLFMVVYSVVIFAFSSGEQIKILELVKAAPFGASAIVIGLFSVLFWALNYVGKEQKIELRLREARELFAIRTEAIDRVFRGVEVEDPVQLATLKAHLLLAGGEIKGEPESPSSNMGFEYADAVKAILRRS